jgi:ABC-type Zn2+ transport system substrate-binding protein/surface adhesin
MYHTHTHTHTRTHTHTHIYADVNQLDATCRSVTARLATARQQTSELISKTLKLQNEKEQLEGRKKFVCDFLDQFQLSKVCVFV